VASRHFLCGVNIKPGKEQELSIFSTFSPGGVVSTGSLDDKSGKLFEETILINRAEYAGGTIRQRRDWSDTQLKSSIERALAMPWSMEMCRNL
jgi:hypothetical protein